MKGCSHLVKDVQYSWKYFICFSNRTKLPSFAHLNHYTKIVICTNMTNTVLQEIIPVRNAFLQAEKTLLPSL